MRQCGRLKGRRDAAVESNQSFEKFQEVEVEVEVEIEMLVCDWPSPLSRKRRDEGAD
jgi:hypothetical protein